MRRIARAYDKLILGLAVLAGLLLAAIVLVVATDVVLRTLGFQPPAMTTAFGEYSLLFATMLASPWLVRERGHIVIESLVLIIPGGARRWIERLVFVLCIALCVTLAWVAFDMGLESFRRGDIDIRAIDMPKWILLASMSIGFAVMAIEFLRLLVTRGSLFTGRRGTITDSL